MNSHIGSIEELEVEQAMLLLDANLVREYEEAVLAIPERVWKEVQVGMFLKCENYDIPKAATRIAYYWKYRKEIFGKDRWLRPMDQTGRGALTIEDVQVLRSRYWVPIPCASGESIILFDEARLPPRGRNHLDLVQARLAYYWISFGRTNTRITQIHIVSSQTKPSLDLASTVEIGEILRKALPINQQRSRVIIAQTYELGKQELIDYMGFVTQRGLEFRFGAQVSGKICRIGGAANSTRQVIQSLAALGIPQPVLPPCLGGSFDYTTFDGFVRMRLTIEGAMSAASPQVNFITPAAHRDDAGNHQSSRQQAQQDTDKMPLLLSPPQSSHAVSSTEMLGPFAALISRPAQESSWFVGEAQPPHSFEVSPVLATIAPPSKERSESTQEQPGKKTYKRTYQRRRETIQELQGKRDNLETKNQALRRENRQLENQLAQARLIAALAIADGAQPINNDAPPQL